MTVGIQRLRRKPRCEQLNRNIMPIYVPSRSSNSARLADGTSTGPSASTSSITSSSLGPDYDEELDGDGEMDDDDDDDPAAPSTSAPAVRRRRPAFGLTPAQRRSAIRRSNAAAGTQQRRTLASMAFLLRQRIPPSPPPRQRRNIPPLPLPTPPAASAAASSPTDLSLPDLPPHSRPRTYMMRPPSPGNMDLDLPPLRPAGSAPPPATGVLPTLQAAPRAPALPELRAPLPLPSRHLQPAPGQQHSPTASSPTTATPAAPSPNANLPMHFPHMQPGIPAPPPFMTGGAPLAQWPPPMAFPPTARHPTMLAGFPMMPPVPALHAMPPLLVDPLVTTSSVAQSGAERDILHLLRLEQQPPPPPPAAVEEVGPGPGALTGGSAESRSHSHGHGHGAARADGLEYFEPEDIGERGVPRLNRPRHTRFVRAALTARFPHAFVGLDASRPWLLYWGLTALSVLGVDVTEHRGR
jgi:hypothetical protein